MYFGPGISVGRRGISYGDSDAQAFISATGLTGTTEVNAVNNLVANLKTYGLWSKMKAIYPFVSDTTNLFSYSEDFTNPAWTKSIVLVTGNTTTAPDGTLTADTIQNQGSGYLTQSNVALSSGTYTQSFFVKKNNNNWVAIYTSDQGSNYAVAWFNLNTGVKGTVSAVGTFSSATSTMTSEANGFYRCSITFTKPTTAATDTALIVPDADNTFTRTIGQNAYIWGAQFQTSSLTTYQPIATTPANRFVSQFKYNLKDPRDLDAAFRLAFNGTWTYSKQGAKANGTSAYASTFFNGSLNQTTNSNAIGFYTNIANTSALTDASSMGNVRVSDLNGSAMTASGTTLSTRLNNAPVIGTISNATGFFTATRQSATVTKVFSNSTQIATGNSGGVPINDTMLIANVNIAGAPYAAGYVSNQFTFAYMADGLSDSDVSNYYTSVQQFNQDLSRQVGVPIVSDSDAQSFLNAAQITDLTQANAINTLVVGLKNASLWTKMKAIYPFVGGTATTHKWNLKDPRDLDAAYRLAFFGAWTHSSTGALPNGTNAYADSFITPSANLNANSTHASYYSRTNVTTNAGTEIGTWYSGYNYGIELNLYRSVAAQKTAAIINSGGGAAQINGGSVTPTTGLLVGSRTSNSNGFVSKNGATIGTNTTTVTTQLSTFKIYLGAANNFGTAGAYSNKESAFASIGDGITESEATTLNTLVTNFETTLGRNV